MRANAGAIAALTLAVLLAFLLVGSFSAVQEAAKAELGLSDPELALAQGVSAAVLLVGLSIPVGALVDRVNRLNLLRVMALVWTLGTLGTAFAVGPVTLFLARMAASIGIAGALTAAISIAADLSRPETRGKTLLILTLGKVCGQAAAFGVTGALFGWLSGDWRGVHLLLAAGGAALALPLFAIREPERREVSGAVGSPMRDGARALWARKGWLLPLYAGGAAVAMADTAATIWAAPVLGRRFGLAPDEFGGWMAALLIAVGLVGATLGGVLADRGRARGRILMPAVIAAALSVPTAVFAIMPSVGGFALAFGLFMLAGTVIGLILAVSFTVLLPNELRGLAIGGFLSISGLAAFGIAPVLVAQAGAALGGESQLPLSLTIVAIAVSLASVICLLVADRNAPKPI